MLLIALLSKKNLTSRLALRQNLKDIASWLGLFKGRRSLNHPGVAAFLILLIF
jgi:hypothetical protein